MSNLIAPYDPSRRIKRHQLRAGTPEPLSSDSGGFARIHYIKGRPADALPSFEIHALAHSTSRTPFSLNTTQPIYVTAYDEYDYQDGLARSRES